MIKPKCLQKGDKVAIVSLSRGMLEEKEFIHKYKIVQERLVQDYELEVVVMPNALKGIEYLYRHPEARAMDLMDAFKDPEIKAAFNAIGGDDTIRLLPFIDFDVLKENPKIFTGFSDTTTNHFMMYKAGLVSYYGLSVMNNLSEYVEINEYTKSMTEEWRGKLLLIETSECDMLPEYLCWLLRNLQAQGIIEIINGIIVGKPAIQEKYGIYKDVYKQVIGFEAGRPDLPILYNVNVGHLYPIGVFPIGLKYEIECVKGALTLLESATEY